MAKKKPPPPDLRLYVNPQPKRGRFSAEWQRAHLPAGEEYVEDTKGKQFDAMLRALRPGSVVVVRRLFCLAPWTGSPTVRKRAMAKRVDAIKAARGVVMEGETGRRTDQDGLCAQMIVDGVADIASAGRAGPKRKRGNPLDLTPEQLEKARLIWFSREHKKKDTRLAAIEAAIGRKLSNSWCYQTFGALDAPRK